MMFKDFLNSRLPVKSQASYVEFGYGQVEPNHLSAQRTGQIYAQLPAAPAIDILEQGQFVKYDYAADVASQNGIGNGIGLVDFTGEGEWMLVYNEIKLYRDHPDGTKQWDCEFAMLKDDYQARIYSPYDYENAELEYKDWHRLNLTNGVDSNGNPINVREKPFTVNQYVTLDIEGQTVTIAGDRYAVSDSTKTVVVTPAHGEVGDDDYTAAVTKDVDIKVFTYKGTQYELDENGTSTVQVPVEYVIEDVTKDVEDIYEWGFTNDPWRRLGIYREKRMPAGTQMVPRVFKTNVGDIYTTNTINLAKNANTGEFTETLSVGDKLYVGDKGILCKTKKTTANANGAVSGDMVWQVVKVYTMPDNQRGVKVMRIA